MSKIAVLIADMFEDVEYAEPAEGFKKAGHTLIHVGLKPGAVVRGKHNREKVLIDRSADDVHVAEFDALFIPGGYSPDGLRAHPGPVKFVKDFVESGKPVMGICHAAQLLITAQVLGGRRVTGWVSIVQDIKNAGADYVDQAVVEDGNLLFSRNPGDIPRFIEASLRKMKEAG
ncbi:protease I [Methanolinea mesophila]|uniref:type 1 glutamine amidotransferase domain-containing protein n=1 Tax=Methanolinea mesophila TaxID=547055 RepID=UPI001AE64F41|nr:type 1 glutamine amidotransferase domain-containing protein [Methanolinea mesophila]MBP1927964.1 protease I [Methanolinea mesophila]